MSPLVKHRTKLDIRWMIDYDVENDNFFRLHGRCQLFHQTYSLSKLNAFFLLLPTVSKLKSMGSSSAIDIDFQEVMNFLPVSSSAGSKESGKKLHINK